MYFLKCRYVVDKIIKPTKAEMFQNVEVGDILTFVLPVRVTGRGSHGSYQPTIGVWNTRTQESTEMSVSQIAKRLNNFELKEASDEEDPGVA